MKIQTLKRKSRLLNNFWKKEWARVDLKQWGRHTDWKKKTFFIKASDKGKIVGLLEMSIMAKVAKVVDLIVAHDSRRKGIGKELMFKAEKLARKHGVHKIHLNTGRGFMAEKFYQAVGYKQTGISKKHFFHHDFIRFSKFL
jgi:GNAT superfamily N-acetyltransferase